MELNLTDVKTLKSSYPNMTIELIGSWLWVSGKDTFKCKGKLKELGFFYSGSKKSVVL